MEYVDPEQAIVVRLERQVRRLRDVLAGALQQDGLPERIRRIEMLLNTRWERLDCARRRFCEPLPA